MWWKGDAAEEPQEKSLVGMTRVELVELYGEPKTAKKDKAFELRGSGDRFEGYDLVDARFSAMRSDRSFSFSFPERTVTAILLPDEYIRNEKFNKDKTVAIEVRSAEGIRYHESELNIIFRELTKKTQNLLLKSPASQNPQIYYSEDHRYIVSLSQGANSSALTILDRVLMHKATDTLSPAAIRKRPRVGMTFDELSELYGVKKTSKTRGTDRAYPNGFRDWVYVLDYKEGLEPEDKMFVAMETHRMVTFSLPQMSIVAFSAPLKFLTSDKFDKEQTIGLQAVPFQGSQFTEEEKKEIVKALTKSTKPLIERSKPARNVAVYYTSDKRYVVTMLSCGSVKILDRVLAHKALDPKPKEKGKLTEGL
jgi:hypothetical protein